MREKAATVGQPNLRLVRANIAGTLIAQGFDSQNGASDSDQCRQVSHSGH
jgi:hypothetical protein